MKTLMRLIVGTCLPESTLYARRPNKTQISSDVAHYRTVWYADNVYCKGGSQTPNWHPNRKSSCHTREIVSMTHIAMWPFDQWTAISPDWNIIGDQSLLPSSCHKKTNNNHSRELVLYVTRIVRREPLLLMETVPMPSRWNLTINLYPHIDTFWRLCSRRPFENIVTKEEIAQNEQFPLLPQCL